jgi:hypothetical protein
MNNLCNLLSGVQIENQHPYFEMAKSDILKLVHMYSNYKEYDDTTLILLNNIKLFEPDLYQLNIVIQYIITYGDGLFKLYLKDMKIDSYNKSDYEQYLEEYIEKLSSFIR